MLARPADRPDFYDWEKRRGDGETRFVSFDMEPGDVVILHPNLQHGGGGLPSRAGSPTARAGLATTSGGIPGLNA